MTQIPIAFPGGFAPVTVAGIGVAGAGASPVSADAPMPVAPAGHRAVDASATMPAGARLILPVDPDRLGLTLTNAGDAAMQVAAMPLPLDGAARPGAVPLAAGATGQDAGRRRGVCTAGGGDPVYEPDPSEWSTGKGT